MTGERWQRVEEVFHRAVDLAPSLRSGFLDTACAGDVDLRREVESLLANDDSKDNLIEAAVSQAVGELPEESPVPRDHLVGQRVGPYLVSELIGEGGMGLVFKARDTELNRSVAIKVLPADRLADPERKRRFLQEAKAASLLNHPNIVTVHGIAHERDTDFIVMEFVSGKTLDQLIPSKGLPLKRAVKYALEIADAVQAAHAAGIVHRDIKPSNIMITEQDRVKVLDFGLAKLAEPEPASETERTEPLTTKAGMVFGTAAYMSPEQAEGKPADTRSDIFSFGALLYQMVTGQRAFPGQNVITILAAVINQEPPALATLVPNAPRELEWIVARCLKKDPNRRIQHMVDVKIALEEVWERLESPSAPVPIVRSGRRWIAPALAAALIGLAGGAWLSLRLFHKEPITFQRLTFRQGDVIASKFGPNGTIVYTAEWDGAPPAFFVGQPGNREARPLELPSGTIQSVSPSGEMALLLGASDIGTLGTLARAPLAGGAPRAILEHVSCADWGSGGDSLAVIRTENGQHRIEYPIGNVLYQTPSLRPPIFLRVSRRGDRVAFFDYTTESDYSLRVMDAQRRTWILSKGWRAVGGLGWSPDGKEVWFGGERTGGDPGIYAVNLSGRERLLSQIAGWPTLQDIAPDGRLLVGNTDTRLGIRCLTPGAKEESDLGWLDASMLWDISNDGREIISQELSSGQGQNPAIYLRSTDGSPAVRLGYGNRPALSPDGKWVACLRRDRESSQVVLLPTGAGEEKPLHTGSIQPETAEWFSDSQHILFTGNEAGQPRRTYTYDLANGPIKAVTPPGVRASAVSPNGQSAIVIRDGQATLLSLASGKEAPLGAVGPGISVIRWSGDGAHLFLQRGDAEHRSETILRMDVPSGHTEIWRDLKLPDRTGFFFGSARLSADGKSYAFTFQRDLATLYLVRGIQ
ncbi:MAG: protein kinase domain-containing protein [Bryobacteraceae bacterium]